MGTWRGVPLLGTLKDKYRKDLEWGIFIHWGLVGDHGGDARPLGLWEEGEIWFYQETSFIGESERYVKEGSGNGELYP